MSRIIFLEAKRNVPEGFGQQKNGAGYTVSDFIKKRVGKKINHPKRNITFVALKIWKYGYKSEPGKYKE
ncbi:hypothetical protein FACS189430_06890 [Bacteroidia bacterium]|nr:hypothetical protein FACS189430_06890 [Bacteroidia bacterium]